MKVLRAKLLLILATYILMACSAVGPEYSPPKPPIPKAWSSSSEGLFDSGKEPLDNWWNLFNDPILSKLIGNVIADNRDVRKAVARIEEARAQLGYVTGTLYPSIDASGSVTRGKQSESVNPQARVKTDYRTTIGASWEIDLFGRIRRSTEAAKANLDAANEDYRGVLISACAETARNYFLLRSTQDQLRAVEKNMESQREILEIVKARFEAGLVSELDVAQAEWALTLSQARIPPLKNTIATLIHSISILTGNYPDTLYELLRKERPIVEIPNRVHPIGIPSDLLRRRPDIRSAERRLAAETARVGIVAADLYPTLSLSGTVGIEAVGRGDFLKVSSGSYGFGPSIRWNIFDAGRVKSSIKIADARVEQALHAYEGVILNAVKEVEDGLVDYRETLTKLEALERSVAASRRILELAKSRYVSGLVSFQTVLDAQRIVLDQETQLAQTKGELAVSIVRLYQALGGGWGKVD